MYELVFRLAWLDHVPLLSILPLDYEQPVTVFREESFGTAKIPDALKHFGSFVAAAGLVVQPFSNLAFCYAGCVQWDTMHSICSAFFVIDVR